MTAPLAPPDFLSGTSGQVYGRRATSTALATDLVADAVTWGTGMPWRLARASQAMPVQRVLALSVERVDEPNLLAGVRAELARSRHQVRLDSTAVGDLGKFENLNVMLDRHSLTDYDWLLIVDDDVTLPRGFLDAFLFLAQRWSLRIAQPAHRALSHAAWPVTRRRLGSVARETAYVEIGPVTAFAALTFDVLLPFPPLRSGWGLDAHWAALAREHEWRVGVVDATPIRHHLRRIAAFYDRDAAIAEGRRFLADKPYVTADEAHRTLVTHRSWH